MTQVEHGPWPTPSTLPPALTSTLKPTPQPDSLFLTALAPEIRLMIYEYVFGSTDLHILIHNQKLVTVPCAHDPATGSDGHEHCIDLPFDRPPGMDWPAGSSIAKLSPTNKRRGRAILSVCSAIYLEAVDILYRRHTFRFNGIFSFIVFPRAIIPHHANMLHHVRLTLALFVHDDMISLYFNNAFSRSWPGWDQEYASGDTPWQCTWNTMGELKSLHTLVVTLIAQSNTPPNNLTWHQSLPSDFEIPLFEPMKQVCCPDFLLRINWPHTGILQDEYPFRVEHIENE
ncbi:uncharacterized protein F4812DRAFT_457708 [Daldinia caldariorum]|uniref:uncharacterized protein n=1 Tax=Daldinia caldariorum TaxID=326644 RepID=UPI0020088FCD|nr:uncharacterized protein F4812DRAFT_457708 [Daldinia caldariorum]KAI1469165.1 hypothetical protein F4812DRAFT_457708 [Daldinia caldariorum]